MDKSSEFSFGADRVARDYDDVLVPILFRPWAEALLEAHGPWDGRRVLDLATGTGIVARMVADKVGPSGSVVGVDRSPEMLGVAAASTGNGSSNVQFIECEAEALKCADDSFDSVICQQGFQFFSDKAGSAKEIHRVLRRGGTALVSVWRPVTECGFFNTICEALEAVDEREIAELMRAPFDYLVETDLGEAFLAAGFGSVEVHRQERDLVLSGGAEQATRAAFSTPIGPKLRGLPEAKQARFAEALGERVRELMGAGGTVGAMASDMLVARK